MPDAGACDRRIRPDVDGALQVRLSLRDLGIDATIEAAKAAAADPTSTLDDAGIPLSTSEVRALQTGPTGGPPPDPMSLWVPSGAPARFGGLWIDETGAAHYVVSIVNADPGTLQLARCLERADSVRYVVTTMSWTDGARLAGTINSSAPELQAQGIQLVGAGFSPNEGLVVVGVQNLTEAARQTLTKRYGPSIRVEEQEMPQL